MKIFIDYKDKVLDMKFSGSVKNLLKKMDINPVNVIVVKNNDIVTEDIILKDSDNIKIMQVFSGG